MIRLLALVLLLMLVVGMLPAWPYSHGWGYYPSGGAVLLAIVVLFFLFSDRRRLV